MGSSSSSGRSTGAPTGGALQGVLRPGARFVLFVRIKHGVDEHWSIGWSDVAAAGDAVVVAPDLRSAHVSARWAEYPSLADMQLLVDYTGGLTHSMCAELFDAWIDDVADLAATPTRFVEVPAPTAEPPLDVLVDGTPQSSWTWLPSDGLLELSFAPPVGAEVRTSFPGPPNCAP